MKSYNELSARCETITNSLSHKPTRYIFAEFSAEMFSEIDRLNRKIKDHEMRLKITHDRSVMLATTLRDVWKKVTDWVVDGEALYFDVVEYEVIKALKNDGA